MKKVEWSPTFEIGVDEIDEDHRHLFALVERIKAAIETKDRKQSSELVQQFITVSREHFAKEEALLTRLGYPEAAQHARYHAKLLEKANALKMICDAEMEDGGIEQCYVQVVSFLIDDVVAGDTKFKSFLHHHGFADGKKHPPR